jgi:uncharacterized protein (DUF1330 family)
MLTSAALGAVSVGGLYAQGKAPGAYAVIEISKITNPDLYKQVAAKGGKAVADAGGQIMIRTKTISERDGGAPTLFIVISFDSMDKAKAWSTSPAQMEVDGLRKQSTEARSFIVDGALLN